MLKLYNFINKATTELAEILSIDKMLERQKYDTLLVYGYMAMSFTIMNILTFKSVLLSLAICGVSVYLGLSNQDIQKNKFVYLGFALLIVSAIFSLSFIFDLSIAQNANK